MTSIKQIFLSELFIAWRKSVFGIQCLQHFRPENSTSFHLKLSKVLIDLNFVEFECGGFCVTSEKWCSSVMRLFILILIMILYMIKYDSHQGFNFFCYLEASYLTDRNYHTKNKRDYSWLLVFVTTFDYYWFYISFLFKMPIHRGLFE